MIKVELKGSPDVHDQGEDYATIATLVVFDDNSYQLDDPDGRLLTEHVQVLVEDPNADQDPSQQAGFRHVAFKDDPATWARNIDSIFRTGYWVPVIVEDTGLPDGSK